MRYARLVPFALTALSGAACSSGHISHAVSATTAATGPSSASAEPGPTMTTATTERATGVAPDSSATAASSTIAQARRSKSINTSVASVANAVQKPQSAGSPTPTPVAPPKPAAAGTYQERQSGSFTAVGRTTAVPPQGSLVVDAAQPDGTQAWHRYVQPGQSPNDTTLQFSGKGIFLLSTTEQSPQGNVSCIFDPAIPAPPWPPAVGKTFSSTGNCGQFTVSVAGRITGERAVVVGGTSYGTWVVDTALSFQGQVTGSGSQEDWYSPVLRIPLHEYSDVHGSYGPFSFSSQLSSDVTSLP